MVQKIGQNLKYQPATYYTHGRSQDIFEGWIKSKSNKSCEIREQGYQNTTSKIYWPQELCTTLSHSKCVGMPLTVFGISLFYFSFFPHRTFAISNFVQHYHLEITYYGPWIV